jgi:phage terminase large subunit-like protein
MVSPLREAAARRKEKLLLERTKQGDDLGVIATMRRLSPGLDEPAHLRPYVELLDAAIEREVEFCFHAPPQHGKTECAKHAFISWAMRAPGKCHAYFTYSDDRAINVMKKVKMLAFNAGLDPHSRKGELYLSGGTEVRFVGSGGGLTGNPVSGVLFIDDPISNRKEAESATIRNDRYEAITDVGFTRRHEGSSVICMATRWHADDPSGRLIKNYGFPYIRLAAVCDSNDDPLGRQIGEALWPEKRGLEFLRKFMVNVYTWASMYQGHPRPRGDALFKEPTWYKHLPKGLPWRQGYGADLAYTEKTRSDHSVLLQGRLIGDCLYLTGMLRAQKQAPEFTAIMKSTIDRQPGRVRWLCSGTEKGVAQFVQQRIPSFSYRIVSADKYVRATPTADTFWNCGKLLVPESCTWANEFIEEVCSFTGIKDASDDMVDALAALGNLFGARAADFSGLQSMLSKPKDDRYGVETIHLNRERTIG